MKILAASRKKGYCEHEPVRSKEGFGEPISFVYRVIKGSPLECGKLCRKCLSVYDWEQVVLNGN